MSSDETSEQLLVHEGAGYDKVFGSGDEFESFSWSSERETLAQSLDDNVKSYVEENENEVVDEGGDEVKGGEGEGGSDGDEDDSNEESYKGTSGVLGDNRPFILPENWSVNKFLPKMSDRVFKELRTRFQIPNHIPLCLLRKNERCYTGRTADVDMYDAMLAAGLRLPLTTLHHQLADFMGLSFSQIAPNAWSIFIGAEILWGRLSGGNC